MSWVVLALAFLLVWQEPPKYTATGTLSALFVGIMVIMYYAAIVALAALALGYEFR